jgi:putative ABC transport system substrate-binding protein
MSQTAISSFTPRRSASGLLRCCVLGLAIGSAGAMAQVKEAQKPLPVASPAVAKTLAVLYPDIVEPYRALFTNIIAGIEDISKSRIRSVAVGANTNLTELNSQLKQQGVKVVIALGQQGWKSTVALDKDISVVVGAVLKMPEAGKKDLLGISMTTDPMHLFARLRALQPSVKKIHVVINVAGNDRLIKLARDAARTQGLELMVQDASDLASAARLYETIFAGAVPGRDAVWLPQDSSTVDEEAILPLVLQQSWSRGIAIFSSNLTHARKGALFALYPNNFELGRELASLALNTTGYDGRASSLLQALNVAVNLRTAAHIGISIDAQQQRTFTSVFPEP